LCKTVCTGELLCGALLGGSPISLDMSRLLCCGRLALHPVRLLLQRSHYLHLRFHFCLMSLELNSI
ncbi:MAG: hypothetical protein ORN21_00970, partial [Methylophilaceae bacterium]|nr:hypothetical protein [Methylophilaceae bacterium]